MLFATAFICSLNVGIVSANYIDEKEIVDFMLYKMPNFSGAGACVFRWNHIGNY